MPMQLQALIEAIEEGSASKAADRKLSEDSHDSEVATEVSRIREMLASGNALAVESGIDSLEQIGLDDPEIRETLSPLKADALAWMDRMLSADGNTDKLLHQMLVLFDLGLDWPEMAGILDKHRQTVVRSMLLMLKHDAGDNLVLLYLRKCIERFSKMGIRWTELRTVWNTVSSELKSKKLDEAGDASGKPDWYMDLAHALQQRNVYMVLNIIRMRKLNVETHPMLGPLLDSFKWMFIRHLERSLDDEFEGFEETNRELKWIRATGVDWDELNTFWDDYKPEVMRQLLRTVSSNDEDAGYYAWQELNALKVAGVKWPELATVLKSALAVMAEKGDKDQAQINEDDDFDDRRREMQQDAYDDYERPNVGDELIRILSTSKDASGLDRAFSELDHMGADDHSIYAAADDNIDEIIGWFMGVVDNSNVESIMDCLSLIDDCFSVSDRHIMKDLRDAIDHRREEFIPWLLKRMKSGRETRHDIKMLKSLVDWPELDTMQRSLDADKASRSQNVIGESTNLLPKKIQNIVDRDIALIRTRGSNFIRTLQWDLRDAGASPSTIDDIFNMNKSVILHALNADMEQRDPRTALSIIVTVMDSMNWPEIRTMIDARMEDMRTHVMNLVKTYHFGHAAHTMDYLKSLNVGKEVFASVRKDVINAIVTSIKRIITSYGFDRSVMDGLDALTQMGTKVDLGSGSIKNKLLSDFEADLKRFGLSASFGNDVGRYVKLIIKHGNQVTLSEMKALIENNKVPVIRNMLMTMKVNALSVYPTLTMLQHLGFKWPELATINKSLKSGGLI